MADRGSAQAFGIFFKELAANGSADCVDVAQRVWIVRTQFDFTDDQLECDGSLVKLGLAREVEKEFEGGTGQQKYTVVEYL